jgi:hypothetical protein
LYMPIYLLNLGRNKGMTVTPKNTYYTISATIVYLLLVAFLGTFNLFNTWSLPHLAYRVVSFIMEGTYFMIMVYLGYFLKYLKESPSITTSFFIYIGFDVLLFITRLFLPPSISGAYIFISLASISVVIYFIIQLFRIKNEEFATWFKLLAFTMIFSMLFRTANSLLTIQHWNRSMLTPVIALAGLAPPLMLLFILIKASEYLNKQQQTFNQAAIDIVEQATIK